ncbi:MAG: hypothetical protein HYR85_05495 [Planctomycetes bacterium]|nr:hypothetical protein [Planctomycetota bacterium]MBI3848254.1 hypothetical protein [Planctomycetota bacterium]
MRPLVVFAVALALLVGLLALGSRLFDDPSRHARTVSPAAASSSGPPTSDESEALTAIDDKSGGTVRIGKLANGSIEIYRESTVYGHRVVTRWCRLEFDEVALLPEKNGELHHPITTFYAMDGETELLRLTADRGFVKIAESSSTANVMTPTAADVRLVGNVVGRAAQSTEPGVKGDVVVLEADRLDVPLSAKKPYVRSLTSDARVHIFEDPAFDVSGAGFLATVDAPGGDATDTRPGFHTYRLDRDAHIEARGSAAQAFGDQAGSNEPVTIDSPGGVVVTRVTEASPSVDRRRLEFAGPVTVTRATMRHTAAHVVLEIERDAQARDPRAWMPTDVASDGGVTLDEPRLHAVARTMHMTFRRVTRDANPTLGSTKFSGSPRLSIAGASTPPGLGTPKDASNAAEPLTIACANDIVLRAPDPGVQELDATKAVRVVIPSAAMTLDTGVLHAVLRGIDHPTLQSIDATDGAHVVAQDVVADGKTLHWSAGESDGEPSAFDVDGSPRLDIANGRAFRSELMLDEHEDGTAEPVSVTCTGKMRIEIAADGSRRTITLVDDVRVWSEAKAGDEGFELRCRALRLVTREVNGKSEVLDLVARDAVVITSPRLEGSGDVLRLEPIEGGSRRRLVLEGKPASIAFVDTHEQRQQIRARMLTAISDPSEPDVRRVEARGDVFASLLGATAETKGRVKPDAEWTVAAPAADVTLRRRVAPETGFAVQSLDARDGVAMKVEDDEATGSRFTYSAGDKESTGSLVGSPNGTEPARLSLRNDYDPSRHDTAVAPEMQFVVDEHAPRARRLKRVFCPKGGEFTRYAPVEDLPGIAPPRSATAKDPPKFHETTITCKRSATLVPYDHVEFLGSAVAKTEDAGIIEGERIVIGLLPVDSGLRKAGQIAGIAVTGTAHVHYGDLEGFADRIELDPSNEWVTFLGESGRDARVSTRDMSDHSSMIHYNRRTGSFNTGPFELTKRPEKKKS